MLKHRNRNETWGLVTKKPTDLSECVSESREYEGGTVVKLNSEKRVSTGDVRVVSEK